MDEDYLLVKYYGMPPKEGFGLGIDRLIMLLTKHPNIHEVILFHPLRTREEQSGLSVVKRHVVMVL
jgi:lysyl-tRNA synthetase class 2